MNVFNDPTSCNDLKLTLAIIALLFISVFVWLYDRGHQAVLINQKHVITNERLKQENKSLHLTILSLQSKSLRLNTDNQLLIDNNVLENKAIALSKQQWQQAKTNLKNELIALRDNIKSLENKRLDDQHKIEVFIRQQADNYLKIKTAEQTLQESRQLSEQQFIEFKQLRRDLAQVKFDADTRLTAIKEWEQEVVQLKALLADTKIKIIKSKQRFTVFEMEQDILFAKGQSQLKTEGHLVLAKLATVLRQYPNRQIAIQGHSDAQKLGNKLKQKYTSNWELAAARAASAVHYLQNNESIKPERIILVSYAHYRPKNNADTPQALADNRRIEITLMPKDFDFLRETTD